MNEFIEYVCRGVIRSEDAIKNLNRNVRTLAKCNRNFRTSLICFGVSSLFLTAIVAIQDKEIRELQKQVADLAVKDEAIETADTTEEQNEQEGA